MSKDLDTSRQLYATDASETQKSSKPDQEPQTPVTPLLGDHETLKHPQESTSMTPEPKQVKIATPPPSSADGQKSPLPKTPFKRRRKEADTPVRRSARLAAKKGKVRFRFFCPPSP